MSKIYALVNKDEFKEFVDFLYSNPKYLLHRSATNSDEKLVIFHKKDIVQLIYNNEDFLNLLNSIDNEEHTCTCCKTISNKFIPEYREIDGCISKYTSCHNCELFDDKSYFTLMVQKTQEDRNRILYPTYNNPERNI